MNEMSHIGRFSESRNTDRTSEFQEDGIVEQSSREEEGRKWREKINAHI